MDTNIESKFSYLKFSQILLGLIALFYILIIGRDLLVPLVLAALVALMLNPMVNYFNRWFHRAISIIIVMLLAAIVLAGLFYFLATQMMRFSEAIPMFKERFGMLWTNITQWVITTFNLSEPGVNELIQKGGNQAISLLGGSVGSALGSISSVLLIAVLVPVYVFLLLLYKPMIVVFIEKLFKPEQKPVVNDVLYQSQKIIHGYLIGLLLEITLITILYSTGLLIIGVDYAVLLALMAALLNLIPYIGAVVAAVMMLAIAFATKSVNATLWVAALYGAIQLIDSNILQPLIIGSKVKINAFASILAVLLGGAVWGIPGMFLAIPMTALIKVVFDRVKPLEPFGYILGDTMPESDKPSLHFAKLREIVAKRQARKNQEGK